MNQELPDVQAGYRKGSRTRDQIASICWIIGEAREFQKKTSTSISTMLKPLTMWIITNCGKLLKRWDYQTILPSHKKPECEWNNWLVQDGERSMTGLSAVTVCLTSTLSTSWGILGLVELQAGIKIGRRSINSLRYVDDTTLMAESEEELRSLLMRVKEVSESEILKN